METEDFLEACGLAILVYNKARLKDEDPQLRLSSDFHTWSMARVCLHTHKHAHTHVKSKKKKHAFYGFAIKHQIKSQGQNIYRLRALMTKQAKTGDVPEMAT